MSPDTSKDDKLQSFRVSQLATGPVWKQLSSLECVCLRAVVWQQMSGLYVQKELRKADLTVLAPLSCWPRKLFCMGMAACMVSV